MTRLWHIVQSCLILAILVFGSIWIYGQLSAGVQARSSRPANVVPVNTASLSQAITGMLGQNSDLDISVSVTDLQTSKTYHWGDNTSYTAASLGKVVTAAAYLHQVEQGRASLSDTVGDTTARDQLTRLIEDSDNDAWIALNEQLGPGTIASYANAIGLTGYATDTNLLTTDGITQVFAKLYQGGLLSAEHRTFLLSLLRQASMTDYIMAAIPSGTTAYHKVGYLDDRLNESAIITRGNRAYVLTIFSKTLGGENYDFSRGSSLFGAITKATLQAFFP